MGKAGCLARVYAMISRMCICNSGNEPEKSVAIEEMDDISEISESVRNNAKNKDESKKKRSKDKKKAHKHQKQVSDHLSEVSSSNEAAARKNKKSPKKKKKEISDESLETEISRVRKKEQKKRKKQDSDYSTTESILSELIRGNESTIRPDIESDKFEKIEKKVAQEYAQADPEESEISCMIGFYDKIHFNRLLAKKITKHLGKKKRKR
ncbi:hypothetical protein ENBRE01_0697 [Enteropsectra breve]|nr:hypothetical protein ENBRE01_0697 [Enteropsectra breve]